MAIESFNSYFIPHQIQQDEIAFTAARNHVNTCIISFIVATFYAQLYYFLGFPEAILAIVICEVLILASLFILKYSSRLDVAIQVMVFAITAALVWLIYHLGGIKSPILYWLILPGFIATFIGGARSGVIWCGITILTALFFYGLYIFSYPLDIAPITKDWLLKLVSFSGLGMLLVALVYVYEADKSSSINKLKQLAYRDGLTKLPNRPAYDQMLENAIYAANAELNSFALIFIDIDNFRRINDLFGEMYGNILLQEIVRRIKAALGNVDTIARVGGDQFKIIIDPLLNNKAVKDIVETLIARLKQPYSINNGELNITASIGMVIYTPRKMQEKYIDRYVELALLKAKETGGDTYQFYTAALATEEASRMEIERSLPNAISNNELELHFQPIFDAKSPKKIAGMEALLRWHSKTLGDVPPKIFIPIAEKIGLITDLGNWVLREACEKYMQLIKAGTLQEHIILTINISPVQLHQNAFFETLTQVINQTGIKTQQFEFELTETAIISSETDLVDVLLKLRNMGICTVIDDFGSGNTSLSYLTSLPVTGLKIDKVFLDKMLTTTVSADVVEAIINLAHKIKLKVVAEGVESSKQLDFLVSLNCDLVQGFYLSRPLPEAELKKFLSRPHT